MVMTGCSVGTGVTTLAIPRGPKELTGVNRIIWSESDHSTNMIHHVHRICNISPGPTTHDLYHMWQDEILSYRNPFHFNTLARVKALNKSQLITGGIDPMLWCLKAHR